MYGDTFLGQPAAYWRELLERLDSLVVNPREATELLAEVAILRGKVSYYENRIQQMASLAGLLNKSQ